MADRRALPRRPAALAALAALGCLASLAVGCRTFEMTHVQRYEGTVLPHPIVMRVYDFDSEGARVSLADPLASPEETAREIGHALALVLVDDLGELDVVADAYSGPIEVPEDTLVVQGQLVSVTEGSAAGRVLVGFGHGESEMETLVRLYKGTPDGPVEIAAYRTRVSSGNEPGILTTLPLGILYQSLAAVGRTATTTRDTEALPAGIAADLRRTAHEWAVTLHAISLNETWF